MEIEARTTTAKDTTEVMAKLVGATDEATSGASDQRRPLTHFLLELSPNCTFVDNTAVNEIIFYDEVQR